MLNELLVTPGHKEHQQIAKLLQNIKSPSTIPFVRKTLESNFDYLEYTCSDSDAIAKWFNKTTSMDGCMLVVEQFPVMVL